MPKLKMKATGKIADFIFRAWRKMHAAPATNFGQRGEKRRRVHARMIPRAREKKPLKKFSGF
ncbi:MAG: hypothetical protein FWD77_08320 [Betaproteobacteria bacterium]|nr:hypothetical protein [Betaproteobacteria bacterium]